MIPAFCRVKHDPERGAYGDCMRACVASVLELNSEDVPHFMHDNCDGLTVNKRLREWLATLNFAPFLSLYPADVSIDDVLEMQHAQNPDMHFILFVGLEGGGDHVVVCCNGKIVHDPAWYPMRVAGPPTSAPGWPIMVIARA